MTKPVVIVVGADKGGVGKTTVSRTLSRTLLDYFIPLTCRHAHSILSHREER